MSQIYYKLIDALLREANHVRGLAKQLDINQMTVSRKLNELVKENVLDYKIKGRNKIFFIKKTLEAYELVLATEHYKLVKTIKKYPQLRRIFQEIIKNKSIKLAILFGSYAKQEATSKSDIDIFIETRDKTLKEFVQSIDYRISPKIGAFNQRNILIKEIMKNHIIIKGAEKYYEAFFEE